MSRGASAPDPAPPERPFSAGLRGPAAPPGGRRARPRGWQLWVPLRGGSSPGEKSPGEQQRVMPLPERLQGKNEVVGGEVGVDPGGKITQVEDCRQWQTTLASDNSLPGRCIICVVSHY